MTQKQRVLRQLETGSLVASDFMVPTCDGGPPIMRVAARIHDLREEGLVITGVWDPAMKQERYSLNRVVGVVEPTRGVVGVRDCTPAASTSLFSSDEYAEVNEGAYAEDLDWV